MNESLINMIQLFKKSASFHNIEFLSQTIGSERDNSLGLSKRIIGEIFPKNVDEVKVILKIANEFKIKLYPVSQGKNTGYGDSTPTDENCLILNLKNLNEIYNYNSFSGSIWVEPGVTQLDLHLYLKNNGNKHWADMTGATPHASIVGNYLEAGFGHTPLGDHRKNIESMIVLLPTGEIFETGEMPTLGPDLTQLFIQSNFGIVLAIKIPLFRIPEKAVTFVLQCENDNDMFQTMYELRELRESGIISSLIHMGNATRVLVTSTNFDSIQSEIGNEYISDEIAIELLNEKNFFKMNSWNAVGILYGSKDEVSYKIKQLKLKLGHSTKLQFFNDNKMNLIKKTIDLGDNLITKVINTFFNKNQDSNSKQSLLNSQSLKNILCQFKLKWDYLNKSILTIFEIHKLLRGVPTEIAYKNIHWRYKGEEHFGLMWYAPVIPIEKGNLEKILEAARELFKKYHIEMPLTLSLTNHKFITAVFSISFDKQNAISKKNAYDLYQEISTLFSSYGCNPYRIGLQSLKSSHYTPEKQSLLNKIKSRLDPSEILSPGRYGIGRKS